MQPQPTVRTAALWPISKLGTFEHYTWAGDHYRMHGTADAHFDETSNFGAHMLPWLVCHNLLLLSSMVAFDTESIYYKHVDMQLTA